MQETTTKALRNSASFLDSCWCKRVPSVQCGPGKHHVSSIEMPVCISLNWWIWTSGRAPRWGEQCSAQWASSSLFHRNFRERKILMDRRHSPSACKTEASKRKKKQSLLTVVFTVTQFVFHNLLPSSLSLNARHLGNMGKCQTPPTCYSQYCSPCVFAFVEWVRPTEAFLPLLLKLPLKTIKSAWWTRCQKFSDSPVQEWLVFLSLLVPALSSRLPFNVDNRNHSRHCF